MATPQEVKQEQIVRLAPFQEEFLADIFASAKGLTGAGSQMPFSKQQLANLSPTQPNTPNTCLLYTSPSPRDGLLSRMPSSA